MWLFGMCIITSKANTDDYSWLLEEAKNLYNEGLFDEAIINCERYLYFSQDKELKNTALFIEAKAFQQKANYKNSSTILLSISPFQLDPKMKALIDLNLALNGYLQGNYDEAEVYTESCDTSVLDVKDKINFELLRLITLCEREKWKEAIFLAQNSKFISDSIKSELLKLLNNPPKFLNKKKLEWFSRFVPGSGQIIAGHVTEGIFSFALCGSAIALGTFLVLNSYYFSGYFIGAGTLYAFYYGGIRRLDEIVEFENQRKKNSYIQNLKSKLKNMGT
ncbi:MAG: hypothetical protein N2662_09420 [Bacteroidales bacterium]|nr:hypothetical protein [Bacteroidales bacterium]